MEQKLAPHIQKDVSHGEKYTLHKRARYEEDFMPASPSWMIMNKMEPTNKICGRTPKGWLQFFLFILIIYIVLWLMAYIQFKVFLLTLSSNVPTRYTKQPGLCFVPILSENNHIIQYEEGDGFQIADITDQIADFLDKYGTRTDFGACTKAADYGYKSRKPCVFLKINRIIGFKPKPIESDTQLPATAPNELKNYIKQLPEADRKGRVWLSCQANDKSVKIVYSPESRAVLTKYLDVPQKILHNKSGAEQKKFYNDDDYERIIAVQLINVPINKLVRVRCCVWAKNIVIGDPRDDGMGQIRFGVRIVAN